MGSNSPASAPQDGDEVVVVVTGFAPFKSQYPINPSWLIVQSLPDLLPHNSHSPEPRVRLLVHPSPIRVSYAVVRQLVPKLWESEPRIDFMVHVGMATGRDFYSVEKVGHRDGYVWPDVDGVVLGDEHGKQGWVWEGCPDELETGVAFENMWMRWRGALPNIDARPSVDAGRYLCDFIYYSSLAYLWGRGEERRVAFLHVPVECDDTAVARGREVLIELIRALVQQRKEKLVTQ